MAEMLELAKDEPLSKMQLIERANLSFSQAQNYVALMSDLKLLEMTSVNPIRYKTTKKGAKFMDNYRELVQILINGGKKRKPREIESMVREKLQQMIGVALPKRKLVIGYDHNNFPKIHEFDFVSDDGQIVGEAKSTSRISRNSYLSVLNDCLYLSKIQAKRKLLVLTNRDFYRYFKEKSDGVISKDIQVMHVPIH